MRTPLRSRILAALAIAVASVLLPGTALAHGRLKSSAPAAGAHLSTVPAQIRLDFSESPELTFSAIRLQGPDGVAVPLGPLTYASDSRRAIVTIVQGPMAAGAYKVSWQMAGDDGHPVRGSFEFVIAPGAEGINRAPAGPQAGANPGQQDSAMAAMHHDVTSMPEGNGFGADSALYVLLRWLQFTALLLAIGAVSFHSFVLAFIRRDPASAGEASEPEMLAAAEVRAARIGFTAVVALAVTLVLRLVAQGIAMHGAAGAVDTALLAPMITSTTWGVGWMLQLAGVVVAGFGLARVRGARSRHAETALPRTHASWRLAALGVVLLAFSPAFSGHAASAPRLQALAILADGLHVLGASSWLGTLSVVLFAGVAAAASRGMDVAGPFVRDLINSFSPVALVSAGVAATTGVFAAWLHVGTVPNLWGSRYGLILLLKLGILSIVALTGFYNWRVVKPRLGSADATLRLRRSARIEVAVALLVLLVTAVLVAAPTALDMKM